MGSITITPAQAADKWKRRLQGSTEDIRNGVNAVQVAPTELAAQAQDKYLAGVQEAVSSGKFAAGCRRVNLADWRDATLNKGLARIGSGAEAAVGKVGDFYGDLFPFEERLMETVGGMPDVTLDDSIARMAAWARGMSGFRRSA